MVQRRYYCSVGNLFFCITLLLLLSGHFYADSSEFFRKTRNILLGVRPLDMTPVEQLGNDSWLVVCAALCHLALVFAIKYLYNVFVCLFFVLYLSLIHI